jgi:hypothetical protein
LRPWVLLLREPIVLFISIHLAIVYGTLYIFFAGFPIVFEQSWGWNQGTNGLAFLGTMVGMLVAIGYTIPDNKRYIRLAEKHRGIASPEARLQPGLIGCIALPVGLDIPFIFVVKGKITLPMKYILSQQICTRIHQSEVSEAMLEVSPSWVQQW